MRPALAILAILALSACEVPTDLGTPVAVDTESLQAALAGRTLSLVGGDTLITLRRNGSITGENVEGRWVIQDGNFCRSFTLPAELEGTECQTAVFVGDQVTFFSQQGNNTTWKLLPGSQLF